MKALSKQLILSLLFASLCVFSGCTKIRSAISNAPQGNAEGYSGNRPLLNGNYYLFDSRAVCPAKPELVGYTKVVEVSDGKIILKNLCDDTTQELSAADFDVAQFEVPVISYNGDLYGYSEHPPTANDTNVILPRARSTTYNETTTFDILVRASGTTENLVGAYASVIKATVSDIGGVVARRNESLGDVAVVAINKSATERWYQGENFLLIHRRVGNHVYGEITATVRGVVINRASMTASDTYLVAPGDPGTSGSGSAITVSGGVEYTCGISDGEIYCWGLNTYGQLGAGTTSQKTPMKVGIFEHATKISAGYKHTCAIDSGKLWCWGNNASGELGIAANALANAPGQVTALSSVTDVSVGNGFTCAVSNKKAYCWGSNASGKLGNGSSTSTHTPQHISISGADITSISAGNNHACLITEAGAAYCWGDNQFGQLGVGNAIGSISTPNQAPSSLTFASAHVSLGNMSCALSTAGKIACWGANDTAAASGTGIATPNIVSPREITSISARGAVSSLAVGGTHACAVQGGSVYCWGTNADGLMGQGYGANEYWQEYKVDGLSGATNVACGDRHNVAVSSEGTMSWGWNNHGQLGDGTQISTFSVAPFFGLDN